MPRSQKNLQMKNYEGDECWLPLQELRTDLNKGFSNILHITLQVLNKAPGHNSHIITMMRLEDRLEIQAAY